MTRVKSIKRTVLRIPVRDSRRAAILLETAKRGAVEGTASVPTALLDDVIALLLKPPEPLPVPEEVLNMWDKVSGKINGVLTSLPSDMTYHAQQLLLAQHDYRDMLWRLCMPSKKTDAGN